MRWIDPAGEIMRSREIIYRFGRRERIAVKGDPAGLKLVPISHPWRSLGGFLDYEHWPDRDRFVELDAAIAVLDDDDSESPRAARGSSCEEAVQFDQQIRCALMDPAQVTSAGAITIEHSQATP